MRLQIERDISPYRPGEVVKSSVAVNEGGSCRELSVQLVYYESSTGFPPEVAAQEVRREPPTVLHSGDLLEGQSFDFSLTVPADALPNFEAPHGWLRWMLEVRADRRGPDETEQRDVHVVSTRQAAAASG